MPTEGERRRGRPRSLGREGKTVAELNRLRVQEHRDGQAARGRKRLDVFVDERTLELVQVYRKQHNYSLSAAIGGLLMDGLQLSGAMEPAPQFRESLETRLSALPTTNLEEQEEARLPATVRGEERSEKSEAVRRALALGIKPRLRKAELETYGAGWEIYVDTEKVGQVWRGAHGWSGHQTLWRSIFDTLRPHKARTRAEIVRRILREV
jgi:hypothetical protein